MSDRQSSPRVMLVAPYTPLEVASHGGRVTGQLARRLARRLPVAVVHLRAPGEAGLPPDAVARLDRVVEIPFTPRDAAPRPVRAWRAARALGAGRPLLVDRVRDREVAARVAAAVGEWRPDVVQFETREMSQYLGAAAAAATVVVDHDPGVDAARAVRPASPRRRALLALDERAWRRFAGRVFRQAGAVVVFTEQDRTAVQRVVAGVAPRVIPIALDVPVTPLDPSGSGAVVLFVGGFEHPPNADAARRLALEIMPRVRERVPEARLELVGRRPTPDVLALAAADGVSVHGDVPDVRPYLDSAAVVALPIRLGGGMRVKALEALAAGKAVVASPLAVAGIDAADGRDLLVRDGDETFAAAVSDLLRDGGRRETLAAAARAWAESALDWDTVAARYAALYQELPAGPGTGSPPRA